MFSALPFRKSPTPGHQTTRDRESVKSSLGEPDRAAPRQEPWALRFSFDAGTPWIEKRPSLVIASSLHFADVARRWQRPPARERT